MPGDFHIRSEVSEDHKIVAQQKLDFFLKKEFPVVECPRILESGDPGTRIGEIARDEEFLNLRVAPNGSLQLTTLGEPPANGDRSGANKSKPRKG